METVIAPVLGMSGTRTASGTLALGIVTSVPSTAALPPLPWLGTATGRPVWTAPGECSSRIWCSCLGNELCPDRIQFGEVVAQADVSTILYQRTLISLVSKTLLRSDEIPIDEDAELTQDKDYDFRPARLRGGADESEYDSGVENQHEEDMEIKPANVAEECHNPFEFDILKDKNLSELDDLPDPRLYGINVKMLRELASSECAMKVDPSYENYMFEIEGVKLRSEIHYHKEESETAILNLHFDKFLNGIMVHPNPVLFFPTWLPLD
jgi:hypothetical protein